MSSGTENRRDRAASALLAIEELQKKLRAEENARFEPIAIIGLGCRFPAAPNVDAYWEMLQRGTDAVGEVPPDRWDVDAFYDPDPDAPGKMSSRHGAFISGIDRFDAAFFEIAPREANSLDPQQRLLLEVSWEALESAGLPVAGLAGSRTGVFIGISTSDYVHRLMARGNSASDAYIGTGTAHSVAAGRLSYVMGLQGPAVAVDTACSSSLVAVAQACDSLRAGQCDLALAGGVNAILSPQPNINFSRARMLAADGRCKTFDAAADGFVRGEGCGVLVLRRLSEALRLGEPVQAVIRGYAVNQDGHSQGLTAPNGPSQQRVIREALANARLKPNMVQYVEAHGTGTALGDPIEVQALAAALGEGRPMDQPLLIGSVKTNIGHLEAAAGVAGLIKLVLSLRHREIPPHLHFEKPSPHIPWERIPIRVVSEGADWPAAHGLRVAGVSSFGFSGTNAHVLVEEAAPAVFPESSVREREVHVMALSARSEPALRDLAGRYAHWLEEYPGVNLADTCFAANTGRSAFEYRAGLVCASIEQAQRQLKALEWSVAHVRPSVAFLFAGQGEHFAGLPWALYDSQPAFRSAIERCGGALSDMLDRPLEDAMRDEALWARPTYAYPALFALGYALTELWRAWGVEPDVVFGDGIGEYTASCVAGVLSLEDALRLVTERGRLEQDLSTEPIAAPPVQTNRARIPLITSQAALSGMHCGMLVEIGPGCNLLETVKESWPAGTPLPALAPSLRPGQDDMQQLAESLARFWSAGITPDWKAWDRQWPRRKLVLPTYPFQRQRFWAEAAPVSELHPEDEHPMLGRRQRSAASGEVVFAVSLGTARQPYLADHRLFGDVLTPGATYPAMAMTAVGLPCRLLDVAFLEPLMIPAAQARDVQLVLEPPDSEGSRTFKVLSLVNADRWALNAQGTLQSLDPATVSIVIEASPESIRERMQPVAAEILAARLAAVATLGLELGPAFCSVHALWVASGEVLAEMVRPEALAAAVGEAALHPALLDACTQVAAGLLSDPTTAGDLFLPVGYAELEWFAPPPERFFCHAMVQDGDGDVRRSDLTALDETGRVLGRIHGLALRRAPRQMLNRRQTETGKLFYHVDWREVSRPAKNPPAPAGAWLIFGDPEGLGKHLSARLTCLPTDSATLEDFDRLVDAAAQEPSGLAGIVCLWSLESDPESVSVPESVLRTTGSVVSLVQALQRRNLTLPGGLWLCTRGASVDAAQTPLLGLGRTLALEVPQMHCTLLDLDPQETPEGSAAALAEEVLAGPEEAEQVWRAGRRYVPRLVRGLSPSESAQTSIARQDASYLITGGLGALGLATAKWLADRGASSLVLVGRHPPNPVAEDVLASLRARGCTVTVMCADVANAPDVKTVLRDIAGALPALRGIVHAAGVLDDSTIERVNRSRLAAVMAPKVEGAWNLHSLTRQLPLDFFLLYSSSASLLGSPGQSGYAAANAFLDGLALQRLAEGLPATVINWGPWDGAGMAAGEGARRSRSRGVEPLKPEQALAALAEVLDKKATQTAVLDVNWPRLGQAMAEPASPGILQELLIAKSGSKPDTLLLEHLHGAAAGDREGLLIRHLQAEVGQVLGLGAPPDLQKGFFDLGMDSLMAVELRNRLQNQLGSAYILPSTLIFDYPTIPKMAAHLASRILNQPGAAKLPPKRKAAADEAIAIIGLSCRFPGSDSPQDYWQLMHEGRDAISEVPRDRWNIDAFYDPDPDVPGKMYTRYGAFLEGLDRFDPQFFGISPREAVGLDPQQRLLLEVSWEAIESTGTAVHRLADTRTGVFIGICSGDYGQRLLAREPSSIDAYFGTGIAHSVAAGRLSYVLGLQGPCLALDTACSSSLVAVAQACDSLRAGHCDMALAGGVNVILGPELSINFTKARMLAPDGRCKTFDAAADGFVRGEGCGVIVLKRLSEARRDGDPILAVVRGSAVNQDGRSSGLTAPNGPAQQQVIRDALAMSGVAPAEVQYVEAHGTGTSLGDPIEVQALAAVLGEDRPRERPLMIGSVKTNIGHLEGAAGMAGLIKVVLALQHGEIPAHLHLRQLNPLIPWDELPLRVTRERTAWPSGNGRRIAGVSSFGFSGTNAHIVLEEESRPAVNRVAAAPRAAHILPLSARNQEALRDLAGRYAAWLEGRAEVDLPDACFTAGVGRSPFEHRAAIVCMSVEQARGQLNALMHGDDVDGLFRGESRNRPKIAFLFTGQGTRDSGAVLALYADQPVFRSALDRCAGVLRELLEEPLLDVFKPDETLWQRAEYAQPALFSMQYALTELWRSWGVEPDAVLGHSLGEYAAACAAGVFPLEDALRLVAWRGKLVQSLPSGGAMAAIFASPDRVRKALTEAPFLSIAADNGSHAVLSGPGPALEGVLSTLRQEGVRVQLLDVTHAFHSALMEPILEEFGARAENTPHDAARIPLVMNLKGTVLAAGKALPDGYWVEQTRNSVQFARGVQAIAALGCTILLEIGPGPVLSSMALNCWPEGAAAPITIPSLRRGRGAVEQLAESLGQFYAAGGTPDWAGWDKHWNRRKLLLPTYPFQRQRYWVEATSLPHAHSAGEHFLLGLRQCSAASGEVIYSSMVSLESQPYLRDHQVFETVPAPGAYYAALALAATGVPSRLRDLLLSEPMLLEEHGGRAVQLAMDQPRNDGAQPFRIFSAPDAAGPWTLHASGVAESLEPGPPEETAPLETWRQAMQPVDVDRMYSAIAGRGIRFGPAFQGIKAAWARPGEALARVVLPDEVTCPPGTLVHPVFLDACLQVTAAALEVAVDDPRIPLQFGSIEVVGPMPRECWCHVLLRPVDDPDTQTTTGDLRLLDSEGQHLGRIVGLVLRRVDRNSLLRGRAAVVEDWLYELAWREQAPRAAELRADFIPDADRLGTCAARADEDTLRAVVEASGELAAELEELSRQYALAALQQLGWRPRPGETFESVALADELGVADRHRRLLSRLLELFAEAGWLTLEATVWRLPRDLPAVDPAILHGELSERRPGARMELSLLGRCGTQLADVLTGRVEALGLLFPAGDGGAADLYYTSPVARLFNGVTAGVLAEVADALPANRRLRVLEVGAGTGATTAALLPLLPAGQTDYVFTDISPAFLAEAQARFAAHSFVRYQVFDAERDELTQGVPEQGFDVIVAAQVMHAVRDLPEALRHLRRLLAPGGLLVLAEGLRRRGWLDLTFGLLPGWWRFADDWRRDYPLLDREKWLSLLTAEGFAGVSAVAPPGLEDEQAVLLARAPMGSSLSSGGVWMIFADRGGLGVGLADRLREFGQRCICVDRGEIDVADPSAFGRLLGEALPGDTPLAGVLYLWGLDAVLSPSATAADLELATQLVCAGALHLAQALAGGGRQSAKGLWLLTRSAQAVGGEALALAQSPLWGLGRSINREHPELRCRLLDLDFAAVDRDQVLAELFADDAEEQRALRAGHRFVPRLIRSKQAGQLTAPAGGCALGQETPGDLGGLSLRSVEPRPPQTGEIQLRVRAAGLNFRDVLNALGMYPGEAAPLGSEFSGEVTAVGPGVAGWTVGDAAFGFAAGAFADTLTTPATFVAAKPERVTFQEAAGIPIAFSTAALAWERARLGSGDRVLIHSAAGGVGLAAVQMAQRLGAEVWATASVAKHDYLRSIGVRHVFDSRSLDFAEQIRAASGGRGVDVVLNSLSGEGYIAATLSTLAAGGRFIEIGRRGIWTAEQITGERPDVEYSILALNETLRDSPEESTRLLSWLASALGSGELEPLRPEVFPLAEAPAAFRRMQAGRHVGKIVLRMPVVAEHSGTWLITGGLRGLGLEVARWLAGRGVRHLALIGRRPPDEAAEAVLTALRNDGCTVLVLQGDVSRSEVVTNALEEVESTMPPLRGVVHAAGVLDDGTLLNRDWERFRTVLGGKVQGAWLLDRLTAGYELDAFVLFSSMASLLGPAGQANHAAANAFLDALAHDRRRRGLPGTSINWGAWSRIGAAAGGDVEARLAAQGVGMIAPDQGLIALEHILRQDSAQTAVLPVLKLQGSAWHGRLFEELRDGTREVTAAVVSDHLRRLQRTAPGQRRKVLVGLLQDEVAQVLRLETSHRPDPGQGFADMGMDSLMSVEMRNRLQRYFNPDPPLQATALFDHPTIDALALHLIECLPDLPEGQPAAVEAPVVSRLAAGEGIAIIGLSCRFPGAKDVESYWEMLREGVDAVREVPLSRWDIDAFYDANPDAPGKMNSRCGGFLDEIERFDAHFFGISPREAAGLDPQQRLLLEVSWEAFERAGLSPQSLAGSRTGVFVGICSSDYGQLAMARGSAAIDAYVGTGVAHSVAAGRLSYVLGLQGPCLAVDTACSSSLVAVAQACDSLRAGQCDLALVGGVNVVLAPETSINFSKARMLAPDGRCKTFDASADGYVRGEGCGVVVLKRLSDARRDGDAVLAVVRGSAVNQDGRSSGLTVPNGPAQQQVIREALAAAGVVGSAVQYVEAHGTGTALGDPIEVQALGAVLGEGRSPEQPLLIGSVKTNIGHLEGAAGIAGLIKAVLAMQHGEVPAHLHFRRPSPHIPWERLAVRVASERTVWPASAGRRLAGVSSFGFSGTNAHVVLEQAPVEVAGPPLAEERPVQVLALSARSEIALRELAGRYAEWLRRHPEADLADVCYTANTGRAQFEHRAALSCVSAEQAIGQLEALSPGEARRRLKIAFLYTGQGSHYAGIAKALYASQPVFRSALDRCAEIRPLADVLWGDDPSLWRRASHAQPALFAVAYALTELWRSWGVEPDVVMGHSLGEYAAACAAGVLSLEEGLRLVAERGRLMEELAPGGGMAAVFADAARVERILAEAPALSLAADNGSHAVLSGRADVLEGVLEGLRREGVRVQPLEVTHAFHSALMDPMLEGFEVRAEGVAQEAARLPMVLNRTGAVLQPGQRLEDGYWARQTRQPVQWARGVAALAELGCTVLVEIGPTPVLLGMSQSSWPAGAEPPVSAASLRRGRNDLEQLAESLTRLYVAGVNPDWAAWDGPWRRRKLALPTYPFQREHYWISRRPILPAGDHILLGRRHASASGEVTWTCNLDLEPQPWLGEHQVFQTAIVPGAFYAALAIAAAGAPCTIRELLLAEPLVLPKQGGRILQLVLAPPAKGEAWPFCVYSSASSDGPWTVHARGSVQRNVQSAAVNGAPEALQARLNPSSPWELYAALGARGIQHGPAFQGITALWVGNGEALGELTAPAGVEASKDAPVHPALLDACLQLIGPTIGKETSEVFLPFQIESIEIPAVMPSRLYCYARLRPREAGNAETLTADLDLMDAAGRSLGRIQGLVAKRVKQASFLQGRSQAFADWLYVPQWQEQEGAGPTLPADFLPEPDRLIAPDRRADADRAAASLLEPYREMSVQLEALSRLYALHALQRLGWRPHPGGEVEAEGLAGRLGVTERHRPLLRRLLALVAEAGWEIGDVPLDADPEALLAELLRQQPGGRLEFTLLSRCGRQLAEVLAGSVDPLGLLFPAGDGGAVDLYHTSPVARIFNGLVADALAGAAATLPANRRLRVLEVGAGTGATTAAVLPLLPAGHCDYAFTDLSPAFLPAAQERFTSFPFVTYQTLDVEVDVLGQGFSERTYDVVLASHVLHAVRDLPAALRQLKRLLAPGGLLVLVEGLRRQGWLDLTFGLLPGWWKFSDDWRADYPLLDREQWRGLLAAEGFEGTAALSPAGLEEEQAVLIASAPREAAPLRQDGVWLVFAEIAGLGGRLVERLHLLGQRCLLIQPGEFYESCGGGTYRLPPGDASAFDRLLAEEVPQGERVAGVLHLWALDNEIESEAAVQKGCASVLHLVQALARGRHQPSAGLWILTRAAQPVEGEDVSAPEQGTLWGLGRVIAREHPELRCRLLDLDPAGPDNEIERLLSLLTAGDPEDQLALRGNRRHVLRLVRWQAGVRAAGVNIDDSGRGTWLITGGLRGLGLEVARWLAGRGVRHLALIGRRPPDEAAEVVLNALRNDGCTVLVLQGDVSRGEVVTHALQQIECAMPPLRGLVHGAGVLDDGALLNQDWERFQTVLGAKVQGAWLLDKLTAGYQLDAFVLFSSMASLLGPAGQGNHAAANSFLDALAHDRRRRGLPGTSINWGAWSRIGAVAGGDLEVRLAAQGVGMIAPEQGLAVLGQVLRADAAQVVVLPIDWEQFNRQRDSHWSSRLFEGTHAVKSTRPVPVGDIVQRLKTIAPARRRQVLVDLLQDEVARVLRLDGSRPPDPEKGFADMGMDSLMAVEVRNRLQERFAPDPPFPATVLFDHPTIADLASYLLGTILGFEKQETVSDSALENTRQTIVDEIEQLSENDLATLVAEELQTLFPSPDSSEGRN